jgi:RHS repeat-associated protein
MVDWVTPTDPTIFNYDNDSNLRTTVFPTSTATTATEVYDDADALVSTNFNTLGRNADELIGSTTPTGGSTEDYAYDPLNRVTTGTNAGATSTIGYGYDGASELTSVTPSGGSTTDYSYNADGQLCWTASSSASCSGSAPTGATTYTVNTSGERTASTPSGGNPTTYGWDQSGALTCETAASSTYSCPSNENSSVTSTYAYNGDGLRTSATPATGSTEQFTWDVSGPVPQLVQDGTNDYLYGPNISSAPIEQISISGNTPSFLLSDTTGVREQVNASGSETGSMSYDSYGNRCSTCSISTPFGFEGGYTDLTSLVYLVNRYYDPATEQFLSVDPEVDVTGTPYAFTASDPVNGSDPSGLWVYNQSYNLGLPSFGFSPSQVLPMVAENFGSLFPVPGHASVLRQGEQMWLHQAIFPAPIVVSSVTSTGWTFATKFLHPDWPGYISFNFAYQSNPFTGQCDVALNVHAVVEGFMGVSADPSLNPWGHLAYMLNASHFWSQLATNIQDYLLRQREV